MLKNKTIVITRGVHQAKDLIEKIKMLGGQALAFPTIKITEPDEWIHCDKALHEIAAYEWIIFSSANSVHYFMQRVNGAGVKLQSKVAVVGKRTAAEAQKHGLKVQLTPQRFTAKELLKIFEEEKPKGKRILLPASNIARDELYEGLMQLGARVNRIVCYKTIPNTDVNVKEMRLKIMNNEIDCLTFFSPSAFHFFMDLLGVNITAEIKKKNVVLAAIGPTTALAIEKYNLSADIQPNVSTEDALVKALTDYFNRQPE